MTRFRLAIIVATTLRLVIAGVAWLRHGAAAFLAPDSYGYLRLATGIATRFAFNDELGRAELQKTPGYPFLLAGGVWAGHPILFSLAVNLLLTAGIVALTFFTVRRLVQNDRVAGFCAFAVAVEPTMMLWSLKVMPETLFTLLILGFIAAALRGSPIAAAAALATAAYTRPIAYPLVLFAILAALIASAVSSRVSWRQSCAFLLTCAALVVPWHARNYARSGYKGFSTLFDRSLYLSVGGSISARRGHEPFAEVRQRMFERSMRSPEDDAARYAGMRHEGWALLSSEPLAYATIHAQGMARVLFDPGAVEYLRLLGLYPENGGALGRMVDQGLLRGTADLVKRFPLAFWTSAALAVLLLPFLAMPLIAAARLTRATRLPFIVMMAIVAYFVVVSGGVPGSSRFRAPVMPLLVIMGAFAVKLPQCRS